MDPRERAAGPQAAKDLAADARKQGAGEDGVDHPPSALELDTALPDEIDHGVLVGERHAPALAHAIADAAELKLDDLTEHLGFELIADGIDTIGGYIFNRLGYLPNAGATLEIPHLAITVRRVSRKRIEEALLEKTGAGAAQDGSAATGVES